MYIQVHWVLKWYTHVFTFYVHVQTVYIHVYALSYFLFTCFNMSIPCIYRSKDIHTWYIQVQTCIYNFFTKSKRSIISGLEPMTSCILASCLDRCATRVLAIGWRFVVSVNCLPGGWWRSQTHVWRWTRSAPQPGHDVSSASTRIALKPRPPGVRPRATRRPHWQCCWVDDSARRQVDSEVLVPSQTVGHKP